MGKAALRCFSPLERRTVHGIYIKCVGVEGLAVSALCDSLCISVTTLDVFKKLKPLARRCGADVEMVVRHAVCLVLRVMHFCHTYELHSSA